jgi:1-acyl-sn-glycerol-3-phosphate acyltransferase
MPAIPQWCVAIEKKSNFKLPIYGLLIKRWGNIPIDRENLGSALQSLEQAKRALASGESIAIMPEGTRSRDGQLAKFKKGGFHLAIDAGATIVPYAYKGLYEFMPHGTYWLRARTIEVVFTPPIDASAYTKEDLPALIAKVRGQILDALDQAETGSGGQLEGVSSAI